MNRWADHCIAPSEDAEDCYELNTGDYIDGMQLADID